MAQLTGHLAEIFLRDSLSVVFKDLEREILEAAPWLRAALHPKLPTRFRGFERERAVKVGQRYPFMLTDIAHID